MVVVGGVIGNSPSVSTTKEKGDGNMIDSDVYALTEKAKIDETTENIRYVVYFPSHGSDINGYTKQLYIYTLNSTRVFELHKKTHHHHHYYHAPFHRIHK